MSRRIPPTKEHHGVLIYERGQPIDWSEALSPDEAQAMVAFFETNPVDEAGLTKTEDSEYLSSAYAFASGLDHRPHYGEKAFEKFHASEKRALWRRPDPSGTEMDWVLITPKEVRTIAERARYDWRPNHPIPEDHYAGRRDMGKHRTARQRVPGGRSSGEYYVPSIADLMADIRKADKAAGGSPLKVCLYVHPMWWELKESNGGHSSARDVVESRDHVLGATDSRNLAERMIQEVEYEIRGADLGASREAEDAAIFNEQWCPKCRTLTDEMQYREDTPTQCPKCLGPLEVVGEDGNPSLDDVMGGLFSAFLAYEGSSEWVVVSLQTSPPWSVAVKDTASGHASGEVSEEVRIADFTTPNSGREIRDSVTALAENLMEQAGFDVIGEDE